MERMSDAKDSIEMNGTTRAHSLEDEEQQQQQQHEPIAKPGTEPESGGVQEKKSVEVSFDDGYFPDQFKDPQKMPPARFYLGMAVIAYNAFILSLYASAYLYVAPYAQEEFHTGEQVSRLPFVFYVMVWGVGTLFLVPLSDLYGRVSVGVLES